MTFDEYCEMWSEPEYVIHVRTFAQKLKSDGCTGVPEFYRDGCLEHDVSYRTGRDPKDRKITRREADKRLRWYVRMNSPFGAYSPLGWWRWAGVRIAGFWSWQG